MKLKKNIRKNLIRVLIILMFLFTISSQFVYADVIWEDDNGVIHGGNGGIEPELETDVSYFNIIIIAGIIIIICICVVIVLVNIFKNKKESKDKNMNNNME